MIVAHTHTLAAKMGLTIQLASLQMPSNSKCNTKEGGGETDRQPEKERVRERVCERRSESENGNESETELHKCDNKLKCDTKCAC